MSNVFLDWAWKQKPTIPASKLLLVRIADRANEQGLAWAKPVSLARDTQYSLSTVYKYEGCLVADGLLEILPRHVVNTRAGKQIRVRAHRLIDPSSPIPSHGNSRCETSAFSPLHGAAIPSNGIATIEPAVEPLRHGVALAAPLNRGRVEQLRKRIGEKMFDAWFAGAEFSDDCSAITLPTRARYERVSQRYLSDVQRVFGNRCSIQLSDACPPVR